VARLAGLPPSVVERARAVLARHEQQEASVSEELTTTPESRPLQHTIFRCDPAGLCEQLRSLNLDEMKPIEALALLHQWRERFADVPGAV